MKAASRQRAAWILVAFTAAYAAANVLVYFSAGTFGAAWLVASVVVYGGILTAAIVLALRDEGPAAAAGPHAPGDARVLDRTVIYRTRRGMAVRVRYLWGDGTRETRLVGFADGESLPLHEIEAHLDALSDAKDHPRDIAAVVDAALAKLEHQEPTPHAAR